ncbi:decaprenyl-phosphate phosphoribosyltransferase [Candidatus Microgenomates bacterium]|nr:decaprenyl-phosphate phosphoribosyltransferase [Candidatus Microgenomates bacterium]
MADQIKSIIKSARPTHWVKNLAVFAALVFSGGLFDEELFRLTLWAAICFSIATSACYFFNDLADRKHDRLHPVKKNRPIAAGKIGTIDAIFIAVVLAAIAVLLASFLSFFFLAGILLYIILQVAYTLFLKYVPIIDILAIAAGFVLRVWAGAFVINAHLSVWFLLCVISGSLFLAAGKRKAEISILEKFGAKPSLTYKPEVLDSYLNMFGTASWMSWSLFTFFYSSQNEVLLFSTDLPLTIAGIGKWLMLTIPVVIFGIMRYLFISYTTTLARSPERTLIRDKYLLGSFLVWGFLILLTLYS